MALNFRMKVTEPKVTLLEENKWYPMRLLSVEEDVMEFKGLPQDKFKFTFVVLDPPEVEGKEVNGLANQPQNGELNERHTLFKWLTAFRGGVPLCVGDELDFPGGLIGKVVQGRVKNQVKSYDGKEMTFQNVKELAVCPNADEFANRAPDKIPPPTAGGGTPPPPPQQSAEPQQATPPVQQQAEPAAQPPAEPQVTETKVMLDGEELDCPF